MGKPHHPSVVVLPRQPRLDQLLTVLPIAQAQQHQGIEVLALALELYAAGFVITFQLQSHGGAPFIDNAPALALRVTDDRGGPTRVSPLARRARGRGTRGSGGSRTAAPRRSTPMPARCSWRLPTSPGTALMQRGNGSSPPAS